MNSAAVVVFGSFALSVLAVVVALWRIWHLSRSVARSNLSFVSCAATIIGIVAALSGVMLFHWPLEGIVLTLVLTTYAGVLWLWSLTTRQPDRSAS